MGQNALGQSNCRILKSNISREKIDQDGGHFHRGEYKTLIKKIFQKEFKKQVENITNLISGNFKLTMQEIHGWKNEVNDLRKSLEFTQNNLEEKVDNVEKRM